VSDPTSGTATDLATLSAQAIEAQKTAYAPYSKFHVGAAIRMGGRTFLGSNVENASYSMTMCAERTAIFAAVAAGARVLEEVAVCSDASPPSSPCGACRQVMSEFTPDPTAMTITAVNPAGESRSWRLSELLPDGFSGRELPP
jgi:cytidine deaminase